MLRIGGGLDVFDLEMVREGLGEQQFALGPACRQADADELAAMLKSGGGVIVNTASVAGVVADPGMAPHPPAREAAR
ncbi:hypothetical protein [Brevundimonas sp.]|uniref:hypothetical protein n=1 Tax=Brevundimonas sp. TaxID=1871086 RepID=UPI0028AE6B95|nr:hypothetical protein [Brevundimonas sp.]